MFGVVFFVALAQSRAREGDYRGEEWAAIEAAACAGVYLTLNVQILRDVVGWPAADRSAFYWATYVATWAIPAAALADAIRAKDRLLLVVGIAAALTTLATNKPYLNQPRETWDPMLLGLVLIGVALGLRRWIVSAPGRCRGGYTADRVHQGEVDLMQLAATSSVAWHDRIQQDAGRPAGQQRLRRRTLGRRRRRRELLRTQEAL